jgi:hypothetical protein
MCGLHFVEKQGAKREMLQNPHIAHGSSLKCGECAQNHVPDVYEQRVF